MLTNDQDEWVKNQACHFEPTSGSDAESLEVAKDCLSEVFKVDSSSTSGVASSDSLVQIFSSQTGQNNEIKLDQASNADTSFASSPNTAPADTKTPGPSQYQDDINKQDTRPIGLSEDELFGQFFGALEKVHYFRTTANGDEEQALERATNLFHSALTDMKQSGCKEIDLINLADTFKLQGNKAMQSKLYPDAIELYTVAIALRDDNAVYYCNRAAAYTQTSQHAEAIIDCQKSISIDPNYSKAYSRLGYAYFAQGNYVDAIGRGFARALQLDPNNESVRENIRAAEQKLRQQRHERGQSSSWGFSNGPSRSTGRVLPFAGPPFSSEADFISWSPPILGCKLNSDLGYIKGLESYLFKWRNNPNGEPEIGIGVSPEDAMPEDLFGAIRSAFQMYGGEHDGPQDRNPNGN
ncbi:small glutamine-rich tetratricopeptide repeat-containing protein [Tanacetum coccineum]